MQASMGDGEGSKVCEENRNEHEVNLKKTEFAGVGANKVL
jgi:hypothetical protein